MLLLPPKARKMQSTKELSHRFNEISWNSLIIGLVDRGKPRDALNLYKKMQLGDSAIQPNAYALVSLLKACSELKDVQQGLHIHMKALQTGSLNTNPFVASSLIIMYAKCGFIERSRLILDELCSPNTVSWTALITGYLENGLGLEALNCFNEMRFRGIFPDSATFVCILKVCADTIQVRKGQEIHAEIERNGLLNRNAFLGCTLVDMYAKCGFLSRAEEVFFNLENPNVASWNSLIHGYSEQGRASEAVQCFDHMQCRCIFPDAFTLACVLRALGSLKAIRKGKALHIQIGKQHFLQRDFVLSNSLMDMYAKCGLLDLAQEIFDGIPLRNSVSWNTIIAGYVRHEHYDEALNCYARLEFEGISANSVTLMCILKACSAIGIIEKGQEVHAEIETKGLLKSNPAIGNSLIDMYAKCGLLRDAQKMFDDLPVRDVVSWTALITGYTEHNYGEAALKYFEQMQVQGIPPNVVTFCCSLKACMGMTDFGKGKAIHIEIKRHPSLKGNLVVGSALINMYATFGLIEKAQEVFDSLPEKNTALWNTLIIVYTECNHGKEALECLKQMQLEGMFVDTITYVWCLKACVILGDIKKAQEIHSEIEELGLEEDPSIGSTLIHMYANFGLLTKAQAAFDNLQCRDVVMWTALIEAYTENEHGKEALECFEKMQHEGIFPNVVTFVCSLKACGSICAIVTGEEIHVEIERKGLLERDLLVGNTLVDMYARCGLPAKAHQVCDKLPIRNAVSWTAVMAGYSQVGEIENVFCALERMVMEYIKPDPITFVVLLNACSHIGNFEKSQTFFESMSKDYGIIPSCEHHNCVVDLLSRTGKLDKAVEMIQEIPVTCDLVVWHTLLSACKKLGNIEVGKHVFDKALGLVDYNTPHTLFQMGQFQEFSSVESASSTY